MQVKKNDFYQILTLQQKSQIQSHDSHVTFNQTSLSFFHVRKERQTKYIKQDRSFKQKYPPGKHFDAMETGGSPSGASATFFMESTLGRPATIKYTPTNDITHLQH